MSNTQKAIEILAIPQECSSFEGQVQTKTTRVLKIYEVADFTSGKKQMYYEFEFSEKNELFGAYPFNLISNYLYYYAHNIVEIREGYMETLKPSSTFTINAGPMSGKTYYNGWQKTKISPNTKGNGYSFDVITEPWVNTNPDGTPADMTNPLPLPGTCFKYARTKTKTSTGAISIWTSKYPVTQNLRRSDILNIIKMTELEYSSKVSLTFNIVSVSNKTHITSMCMDVVDIDTNKKKGIFYINGEDTQTVSPSGLVTSYGKSYPGYIFQWRLYNGDEQGVYGCTLYKQFAPSEDNTITIIPGGTNSYDATTKTLSYNVSRPEVAKVLAYAEFLPAQGKNENIGRMYNLETSEETNW
jgi:hypothetical protein